MTDDLLRGKRVIVTRPRDRSAELTRLLERRGAVVIHAPTIEAQTILAGHGVEEALRGLERGDYEWVLFTSAAGVSASTENPEHRGALAYAQEHGTRVGAVGPSTADALEKAGVTVDLLPEEATGEALARSVGAGSGRVLLLRAEAGRPEVAEGLRRLGREIDDLAVYRTVAVPLDPDVAGAVASGDFDAVVFASPSAAAGFVAATGSPSAIGLGETGPSGKAVVCIGPTTAAAARSQGLRVDAVARAQSASGLIEALEEAFRGGPSSASGVAP